MLLLASVTAAQPRVQAHADKIAEGIYQLVIEVAVPANWHVYAKSDEASGITGPEILAYYDGIEPKKTFSADISPVTLNDSLFNNKPLKVYKKTFRLTQEIVVKGTVPANVPVIARCFASNGAEFLPIEEKMTVPLEGGYADDLATNIKRNSIDIEKPIAGCGVRAQSPRSLASIFLVGIVGGFLALLTPCVFPMLPVTVAFFTSKKEGARNGIMYGVFIFLIYATASLPFHLARTLDPQLFNTIATNGWVNMIFFLVFLFFALSFFGVFDIRLPSWMLNSAGSAGNGGSVTGIFFMALTLVVVSFSCTGPILGSLLVGSISSANGAWQLTAGMSGFGIALALPFGLFAIFPGWMKKLPRSGGWMETVKKSLAFVELALALKFFSNADLVMHWGIFKREIFVGAWALIAFALGIFLVAPKYNSWFARVVGFLSLLFGFYLTAGLGGYGDPELKLLSGLAPPSRYSITENRNSKKNVPEPVIINDYDSALAIAKRMHKPLLVDFTGWACVNCRRMEEQVWSRQEVAGIINEKFVLVSLYVDDRARLKNIFNYKGKDFVTLGDKWAGFEAENFAQVSQPLYVLLSPDEKLLNSPVGYTPDAVAYAGWLRCGLDAMQDAKKVDD